jgi:hypothetical protein
MRALVAIVFHRPGLWLFYGIRAPAIVRRRNKAAICIVVPALAVTALIAPPGSRITALLVVWAVGHLLWGVYLACVFENLANGN